MKPLDLLLIGSIVIGAAGCGKLSSPPPVTTRPEASAKFKKIIKEEFHYPMVIKDLDHTVWAYVPLEENILEIKATDSPKPPPGAPAAQQKQTIRYLKAAFQDKTFQVHYDIGQTKQYGGADPGYQMIYPESFQNKQRNIITAVSRAYLDMEEVPGDVQYLDAQKQATHKRLVNAYVKPEKAPTFFVIVYADIIRGIKMVNTVHFRDLKNAMTGVLGQEEYNRRNLSEVKGDTDLIGDKTGERVKYQDIELSEFVAKQIEYRINLKYQQSSFPPGEDAVKEILQIVTETTQAYNFTGFAMVKLYDLASGKLFAFNPSQLKTFQE